MKATRRIIAQKGKETEVTTIIKNEGEEANLADDKELDRTLMMSFDLCLFIYIFSLR